MSTFLLQISGTLDAVKKALQSVSQHLLESYPRFQDSFPASMVGPSSHSFGPPPPRPDRFPPQPRPFHGHGAPFSGFHDGEAIIPGRAPEALTFRLLCNEEKVGGVIGKGGSIIKALQHETGCEIKVLDGAGGSEDRLIIISGPAVRFLFFTLFHLLSIVFFFLSSFLWFNIINRAKNPSDAVSR